MPNLPPEVLAAWNNRNGAVVLTTVDANGLPNSIYASSVGLHGDDTLVVADNYFDKTRKNLESERKGLILFMTKDNKAYQIKGRLEYHRTGVIFDEMKQWNSPKHPGVAAAALHVEEVYSGGTKLL